MRHLVRLSGTTLAAVVVLALGSSASAGVIAEENARRGVLGWASSNDGTANGAATIDVYPARWSIAAGEPLRVRVRATAGYDLRVVRLGWYGGAGARELVTLPGNAPIDRSYPSADPTYGFASAAWSDTHVIPTDATWPTGVYEVQAWLADGTTAETFFVVRDDGAARAPILVVVPLQTLEAYNGWPGPSRGGKSLYPFNSSPDVPSQSKASNQAVKVSFDRPFLAGVGLGDLLEQQVPAIRWLERMGFEVAYATDVDLDRDPTIALRRSAVVEIGHAEYWSRGTFDAALASRDAGVPWLFLTGDTLDWQVRFEAAGDDPRGTLVGYKESWQNDPEQIAGVAARKAGDLATAKAHFAIVTRGWKDLENDPTNGIDERRPGMLLTGVDASGAIHGSGFAPDYPWADLVIADASPWFFAGTGLKSGDRIPNVMGYELDSTFVGDATRNAWRPSGQITLGQTIQPWDGTIKGGAGFYTKTLADGRTVDVIAFGAIGFSWALDDFVQKLERPTHPDSVNVAAQTMIENVLVRWTGATPTPPVDPPPPSTSGGPPSTATASASTDSSNGGCACSTLATRDGGWAAAGAAIAALVIAARRRRRA